MKIPLLHFIPSPSRVRAKTRGLLLVLLLLLLTTLAHAQTSQFLFDDNGNLAVQTSASIAPPQILGQPQNVLVAVGEPAALSVIVADPLALTYQWRFNGSDVGGATSEALFLQNVTTNNEGFYQVVLTNPSGSVTSAPAFLWIDNDGDGMADSWELADFGNLNQLPNGDFEGDGASNLQEFLDGTDPTSANSVAFHLSVVQDGGSVTKSPDLPSYTNGQSVTLTASAFPGGEPFHAWTGDVVTRENPLMLVMTNNKTIYARFTPIAFVWTNVVNGDWESATNWTPNLVPGSNDTVVITKGNTITLNTAADCADFTLGGTFFGGTLTGSGTLMVRGNFLWTQGTMTGSGRTVIETGATLNVVNEAGMGVGLATRVLENGGTVVWSGSGSLSMSSGALITNRAGALFQVQNAGSFVASPGARFDNAGMFRKSVDGGTMTIPSGLAFNNFGAVEIQTGTLSLNGGGTNSGSFDVTTGATLAFSGGTVALNPGAQLNGAGLYQINNATVTASPDITVENLELIGGTFDGGGELTIGTAMSWTGGTMSGGGRTIISPGATLNAAIPSLAILSGRTLENGGTILFTGIGSFGVNGGAVITNRPGAMFDFENEGAFGLGGGIANGRFDNAGTFRKSAGTGTSTIVSGMSFNNSGTVEIQTGTLVYKSPFDSSGTVTLSPDTTSRLAGGGSAGGTFTAPASALVEWAGGTFTLNPGAQLHGAGLYRLNGGSVSANASLSVENLDLVHGSSTLGGTGAVTIADAMNWTGGTMNGGGRTIISPGATLSIPTTLGVTLNARTLENGGSALFGGTSYFSVTGGAVITNCAGALFQIENESAGGLGAGIANGRFDNAGTFRKSAGIGTTTITAGMKLTNYNTVDLRSGFLAANGGYVSSSNAVLNCALGGTAAGTGYGQLQVAGTVNLNGSLSVDFTNGFSPALDDAFTVLTAGTRNGSFTDFYYPSNQVTMEVSNTANSVIARVTGIAVPAPLLLSPVLNGSNVLLTWTAISNASYRLEFNPDLAASNWNAVTGDVTALSNTASKLDPLTSSNRYYRVRLLP